MENKVTKDKAMMSQDNTQLMVALEKLQAFIGQYQRVMVAYSGGVDSTVLLKVAVDCLGADKVRAYTSVGKFMSKRDLDNMRSVAQHLGIVPVELPVDELDNELLAENTSQRCFYCKQAMCDKLMKIAELEHFDAVLGGANTDDYQDFRPGMAAAEAAGMVSPFQQCGISKTEIRQLAHYFKLPNADRPSESCLATRISYGISITEKRLAQIEQAEKILYDIGIPAPVRVRHHGELARIEVSPKAAAQLFQTGRADAISRKIKELGFRYVAVDLQGYRTGSGNEVLDEGDA